MYYIATINIIVLQMYGKLIGSVSKKKNMYLTEMKFQSKFLRIALEFKFSGIYNLGFKSILIDVTIVLKK